MASQRQIRERDVVRRYLTDLADSAGNAAEGCRTIDDLAYDLDVPSQRLREFRDGLNESLDRNFVTAFARLLGRGDVPGPDGFDGVSIDDAMGFGDSSTGGWYSTLMAEETQRIARARMFQLIDRTRPEAMSALDAWADLGVTGNITDDAHYSAGAFEPVVFGNKPASLVQLLEKVSDNINRNIFPDDEKWLAFRGTAKFGNQYGEIALENKGGRQDIAGLRPLHPRTMMVNRDRNPDPLAPPEMGLQYDPAKAFKQVPPGRAFNDPIAFFPEWKIMHIANRKNWGDWYGESIFDSCLRSYVQIESMEAAMIIRRLERASMRYKHSVDVGLIEGGDEAVKQYLDRYRARLKRQKTIDGERNMRSQKINLPVNEDIYIPKRTKDSPADVDVLKGDENIGTIEDFNHFFNKFLAGLGPPKAHLGYESDTMRSVVTDLHIVFARKVRRMQLHFISGLQHLYYLSLMLRGIDPRSCRYSIFPPSMGTKDELTRAQVQLAHATTVQYLAKAFSLGGKVPTVQWILRYLMGMDDEAIEALDLVPVMIQAVGKGGAGMKNDPALTRDPKEHARMVAMAKSNPEILEATDHLHWMLEERAIAKRTEKAARGFEKFIRQPFRKNFDRTVRLIGITELRRMAA